MGKAAIVAVVALVAALVYHNIILAHLIISINNFIIFIKL